VLLVSGIDPQGVAVLNSINFSWATMDRTWRWRSFPVPARYFEKEDVLRGQEAITDSTSESLYPQTIHLREDLSIHVKGTCSGPDGAIVVGRWYQRYLPATNELPDSKPLGPDGRPAAPYTHPWKFLPESVFQLADQFSHLGVYDVVNSRTQYYVVLPEREADKLALSKVAAGGPWADVRQQVSIHTYLFRWQNLRIPLSLPPPKGPRQPPSLVNPEARLRIVKRGSRWIGTHWDKRDDDLLPFTFRARPPRKVISFSRDGKQARVALKQHKRSEEPPVVQSAYCWLESAGSADASEIAIAFTSSRHALDLDVDNISIVHMAALDPTVPNGVARIPIDGLFTRTGYGHYERRFPLHPTYAGAVRRYCSEEGAWQYGTSIWFEDIVGHVAPPEALLWRRPKVLRIRATPNVLRIGMPMRLTVFADDAVTGDPVDGVVELDGTSAGRTGVTFTYTFKNAAPIAAVWAHGYIGAPIPWAGPAGAYRQRVLCTSKKRGEVVAVGGRNADGTRWTLAVGQVIGAIANGALFYTEQPTGDRVPIVVAERRVRRANGEWSTARKYIKTAADGDRPNNLLALPDCK
jgi:hypothetical protein